MSCTFEEELTAYVDGELGSFQERQVDQHLPGCESCRATLELLKQTVELVEAMPSFQPSSGLRRAVLNRIDEPPSLRERLIAAFSPAWWVPVLGFAAAALVAVAINARRPERAEMDLGQLELAANLEVVEDYDVLGLDGPEDLEVIQHLQELEAQP
jgi:anti-sigma factor RsiW